MLVLHGLGTDDADLRRRASVAGIDDLVIVHADAGIVGKWAHYVWLQSSGAVVLRYPDSEHRYERRIQGGSMLFAGEVVREVRFSDIPRTVDSDIQDRSMAQGAQIYSADRYNYVSIRGADRHAHTWDGHRLQLPHRYRAPALLRRPDHPRQPLTGRTFVPGIDKRAVTAQGKSAALALICTVPLDGVTTLPAQSGHIGLRAVLTQARILILILVTPSRA